ncbi:MAG: PCMD domain-containing protein [Bacteroidales bacterium]|nr:PCMD domain-containing protein [Bacteroidales bacterium]
MKLPAFFALWTAAVGVAISACTPVKELNDEASISQVQLKSVYPSSVVMGAANIEPDRVEIPLIFGKYLFPIELELDIAAAQKIDKIIGLDRGKLVFNSLEDIHRIDLIALSGVVHSYIFRLQEVPSRENADIEKFEITSWTPNSFLFAKTPYYNIIHGCIEIIGISDHFPFTIVPDITVSEGARVEDLSLDSFAFTSYHAAFPLQVVAESGKERTWQIRLKQAQIIRPDQAPDADVRERMSFNAQDMRAVLLGEDTGAAIKSIWVDVENSLIKLEMTALDLYAQWEALLSFSLHPYTQIVGYEAEQSFRIDGMGIQKGFYLIDMLEGYGVEWQIESVAWLNPAAEVESFELLNYESGYGLIELGVPLIYPLLATVEIPVERGFDFPLTVDAYRLQISEDATFMEPLPQNFVFNDFDATHTLKIQAQNESVKSWTIALFDARSGSNDARVNGYTIKSYSGTSQTSNNLILAPAPVINLQERTISFRILDWANKFPLRVEGHVDISQGAVLVPFSFTANHEFVFHSLEDTFSFSVVSENGESQQTWRVVLQNEAPTRNSAKEVTDFVSGAALSGFSINEKYLEPGKRQITLVVTERIEGIPLILAPRISVSPSARLLDIVSGAPLSLSFEQPKLFYVQAEDESTEEWRIVLIHAPQIPNSDFESWGRANNSDMNLLPANGTGWCTSNNSNLSNTVRVAGYNSPYAVQMQTVLQTMNFVIFRITTIAASSAFLGKFTLKTGVNDVYNPISMTNMGIPFAGNTIPIAFSIDYKYIRGAQMMFTEPNWGSLIPSFRSPVHIPGTDAASLRVELFHHPTGVFDYAAARSRNEAIARGEILERNNVPEWTQAYVPIEIASGKEGLTPTHIVIVLTPSHEGDQFKGAPGSILTADNLRLIYYKPEEGAIRLE